MTSTRHILLNTGISLLSLLLTLMLCEGIIRTLQYTNVLPVFDKKLIDKGDTPNKHVNAKLVRSDNPVLFMEFDHTDPNINNAGYRGADFQIEKPAGVTRIAILGDSVAYGYSVPIEQTFATLIEKQLNARGKQQYQVLNFAVNGYSTIAELELYKTRVQQYHPDIVLLSYVLNDPLPAAFVVQSVGSARKQVNYFKQLSRYSQLGAWVLLRWQTLKQPFDSQQNYNAIYQNPEGWQATVNSLAELRQLTRADNVKLAAVIFPLLLDFNAYPFSHIHQQVNDAMAAQEIPHIDLLPAFSTIPYLALRPHPNDDTHPNAQGHAIAAEKITALIESLP